MKVRELIECLQACDPAAVVLFEDATLASMFGEERKDWRGTGFQRLNAVRPGFSDAVSLRDQDSEIQFTTTETTDVDLRPTVLLIGDNDHDTTCPIFRNAWNKKD